MYGKSSRCNTCRHGASTPLNPMTPEDVAWVAGLLEGEGAFVGNGRRNAIRVMMTDLDVLEQVQRITGCGNIYKVTRRAGHHKQAYVWSIRRNRHVAELAACITPFLSTRRRDQLAHMGLLNGAPVRPLYRNLHGAAAAWVAGLIEGEGCLGIYRTSDVKIEVASIDRDVLDRLRALCGGSIHTMNPRRDNRRVVYRLSICARQDVVRVLVAIQSWLLSRRSMAATGLLQRCNLRSLLTRPRDSNPVPLPA
jgi:LAGLIDADG-like domain